MTIRYAALFRDGVEVGHFNPEHDNQGRFASGGGGGENPHALKMNDGAVVHSEDGHYAALMKAFEQGYRPSDIAAVGDMITGRVRARMHLVISIQRSGLPGGSIETHYSRGTGITSIPTTTIVASSRQDPVVARCTCSAGPRWRTKRSGAMLATQVLHLAMARPGRPRRACGPGSRPWRPPDSPPSISAALDSRAMGTAVHAAQG